ncbi:MAG: DSBA oxidoreductase [Parcubacteria group bacterium Gr01-1014_3]|nr:MAG: DSBA oxidoreductase [Parcubacteria group bacterium Gr01-1014_3]
MKKSSVIWVSTAIILAILVLVVSRAASGPGDMGDHVLGDAKTITASDWIRGSKDAKVVLVEYSDFQCPACAAYFPAVEKLIEDLGANFAFVYRHFPLNQHVYARPAAMAAEAAGKQGKFWEMYRMIFDNQITWTNSAVGVEIFEGYARQLELDLIRYALDLKDPVLKTKVEADFQSGLALGVNATPTFYLNGRKLNVPNNYDEFKSTIQSEIDLAK